MATRSRATRSRAEPPPPAAGATTHDTTLSAFESFNRIFSSPLLRLRPLETSSTEANAPATRSRSRSRSRTSMATTDPPPSPRSSPSTSYSAGLATPSWFQISSSEISSSRRRSNPTPATSPTTKTPRSAARSPLLLHRAPDPATSLRSMAASSFPRLQRDPLPHLPLVVVLSHLGPIASSAAAQPSAAAYGHLARGMELPSPSQIC